MIQPQYQKWIAKLLGYSFEVIYKLGLENKAADALSSVPPTVHLNHISAPTLIDLAVIQEEIDRDPKLKEIKSTVEKHQSDIPNFSLNQGVLQFKGMLVISKTSSLLPTILHTYHDSVFRGHSGLLRTYKRITGELYWNGMKSDIKKYCAECLICQRNKTLALSPERLLMPLEIPDSIWSDILWIS